MLFADAATGAHSPALVSQGKIGAVISAKPVERRQLLEEAAGISGLHARRKDAEQKLRATEANLTRLGEILGEQEQRAAQLRRQARAAERYRKLTEQIRRVEARLLARPLDRGGDVPRRRRRPRRRPPRKRSSGSTRRSPRRSTRTKPQTRPLPTRRNALAELREEGHALAHQLAAARARRDTVARRLAELERLDALARDRYRSARKRSRAMRLARSRSSKQERVDHRPAARGFGGAFGADRHRAERRRGRIARSRSGARRTARAAGGDARGAAGGRSRARGRARAARANGAGAAEARGSAAGARRRERAGARAGTRRRQSAQAAGEALAPSRGAPRRCGAGPRNGGRGARCGGKPARVGARGALGGEVGA